MSKINITSAEPTSNEGNYLRVMVYGERNDSEPTVANLLLCAQPLNHRGHRSAFSYIT